MKILSALNAFKGAPHNVSTLNEALGEELRKLGHEVEVFPIADGGDGTLDAFKFNLHRSPEVKVEEMKSSVQDPLGRPVEANWLWINGDRPKAIIEFAQASGIALLKQEERHPPISSSFGTGELIREALELGAKEIVITLGGSATIDGGIGMMAALGAKFKNKNDTELSPRAANMKNIESIDLSRVKKTLGDSRLIFLSDVKTPLRSDPGEENVMLYADQKFPSIGDFSVPKNNLDNGFDQLAQLIDKEAGSKVSREESTGAAGGAAYIPRALLRASSKSGIKHLSEIFGLKEKIQESELIITGEGFLDRQTLEGKAPAELIRLVKELNEKDGKNRKLVVICGDADGKINWKAKGIDLVIKLKQEGQSITTSIKNTLKNLRAVVKNRIKDIEDLIK